MNSDWRRGDCLDTVADFPKQLTVEKRKVTFRFDQSWDGSFQYKCLLDGIMLQGGFWVGRLVQLSTDHDYSDRISNKDGESDTVSRDDQVDSAAQDQQPEDEFRSPAQEHAASAFQADDIARDSGQRFPLASVDRSSVAETPLYWNEGTKPGTKPIFPRRISDNGFKEFLGTHSGYQFLTSTMTRMIDNRVVTRIPMKNRLMTPQIPMRISGSYH